LGEIGIGGFDDFTDADGGRFRNARMVEEREIVDPHLHHVVTRLKVAHTGPRRRTVGVKSFERIGARLGL
jgi:hypothetical protein